jgi:putative ABC transport system permease protein
MQTIDGIFSKVAFVIEFMAAFTVLTGVIVCSWAQSRRAASSASARRCSCARWVRRERQLMQIQFVEYAILGVLSAVVGGLLALAGNALVIKFVFRLTPSVPYLVLAIGTLAVTATTVIAGLLSSRGITNHPPLEVLRQET